MRYNSLKCIFSFKIINISAPTILQDPLMTLYSEALKFCEERQSQLIEIYTEEQMNFVVNQIKVIKIEVQHTKF